MTYRSDDHKALAKQAPHCMDCGVHNDGSVVAAHANHIDKGMGLKAPDWAWAALCGKCHALLDQGATLDREDRRAMWLRAFYKTQTWLWTSGLICIAAEPVEHVNPTKRPSKPIRSRRAILSPGFQKPAVKQKIVSRDFPKRRAPA